MNVVIVFTNTLRDDELVKRGSKAVVLIFQLSSRVPGLIEHSQLERREGSSVQPSCFTMVLTIFSMDHILVSNIPCT